MGLQALDQPELGALTYHLNSSNIYYERFYFAKHNLVADPLRRAMTAKRASE
jgi:hypothetical protein